MKKILNILTHYLLIMYLPIYLFIYKKQARVHISTDHRILQQHI